MLKKSLRVVGVLILLLLIFAFYYGSRAIPIATGYGAKLLCSSIFVSGRAEKDIIAQDLNFSPLNLADYTVNYDDSSVTCSLYGLSKQKAIFRHGLGATLVSDINEDSLRAQAIVIPPAPHVNQDSIAWPMGNKIIDSFPVEIDSIKVAAAVTRLFDNGDTTQTNITRALIVLYDGRIVAEKYGEGISATTRLTGWSMTKSITSALGGILFGEGRLNLTGPAPVPEWQDKGDDRHAISVTHLLQQTTGLDFKEVYDKPADANRMLFQERDAAAYTASRKLSRPPGTHFRYSSGNTNILSRIYRQTLGDAAYHALPYTRLFYKLGMYSAVLEPDASGTFVGSSFCYATARDWARFGLLYQGNGTWNNEQILTADWVRKTVTPATAAEKGEYGFQWWLNAGAKGNPANRLFPGLPVDMYWADGFEGQNVFVIPSKKLVVVRLGLTRGKSWGEDKFLSDVIAAIN
jgi:CubicO group peptidase (beta-lactamase class C family)